MPTAICFGELLVDMVSEAVDASLQDAPRFLKAPGGAPANVAVGLQRLGTSSAFVSQVGDDPFGDFLSDVVAREGVDVSGLLRSSQARTTLAFIATRSDGRKEIAFYRHPGADALLSPADVDALPGSVWDGARLFHCGSVSLSQSPCREAQLHMAQGAKSRGLLITYDPNWRPSLWDDLEAARETLWRMMPLADVVKLADEEFEFVTGTADLRVGARRVREVGPKLVVVTRGPDGAFYDCETATGEVPGFAVTALDTLGAGDAFMAGLLSRLLAGDGLDAMLNAGALDAAVRFANACGALATQTAGAIPALPVTDAVTEFLATR